MEEAIVALLFCFIASLFRIDQLNYINSLIKFLTYFGFMQTVLKRTLKYSFTGAAFSCKRGLIIC